MNKPKNEVIFVHQNLIPNRSTYLVHTKSTGELISFGFSDRSDRSLVSAKRSANRWDQTKKRLHFLAYLWSQSEFRTRRKSQWTTDPQSEMTRWLCYKWMCFLLQLCVNTFHTEFSMYSVCATASTVLFWYVSHWILDAFHIEFSMYSVCATASTVLYCSNKRLLTYLDLYNRNRPGLCNALLIILFTFKTSKGFWHLLLVQNLLSVNKQLVNCLCVATLLDLICQYSAIQIVSTFTCFSSESYTNDPRNPEK